MVCDCFFADYEYDYEDGEEYDYGSDNDGEAADELIEIENAFYEGDGEKLDAPVEAVSSKAIQE